MKIEQKTENETTVLMLEGWLDTQAAPRLEEALKNVPENTENLVLECEKLEYISSSGIRQIVAAYKQMDGALLLKNVPEEIKNVLDMTGIAKRIKME